MRNAYNFEKNDATYLITETRDYIVTNWDYKGIFLLDKNLGNSRHIFIEENMIIDQIFVDYEGEKVALYCPENASIVIFDINTKQIKKIKITSSLNLYDGSLTSVYYWVKDQFIMQSRDYHYFKICTKRNHIIGIEKNDISPISSGFYSFILKIHSLDKNIEIINVFSQLNQLTYQNKQKKEIGFIDCKNNIHNISEYEGEDVHALYFVKDKFIIVRCYSIESVVRNQHEILIKSNEASEFERSVYDGISETVYVLSRYWQGRKQQMTLYALRDSIGLQ